MKKTLTILSLITILGPTFGQQKKLLSPDKKIEVILELNKTIEMSIQANGTALIKKLNPKILLNNGQVFGEDLKVLNAEVEEIDQTINAVIPTKSNTIKDHYNVLRLDFGDYSFEVRAYNNGVSYRFVSNLDKDIEVLDEKMNLELAEDYECYLPEEKKLISHFENYYKKLPVSAIEKGTLAALPTLFTNEEGVSVVITESNLWDYPNLFLEKSETGFTSRFPKYVLKTKALEKGQDRLEEIEEAAPYIAKTSGKRAFPWRVFMIADNDKQILQNNLVYQLASPLKLEDISWIKPGKVAWDWWNANNIYGVDFKSGLNTQTYKYYIDFASQFGIEYIILDEGWSKSTLNVLEANPEINMEELTAYAKSKGVGIILWSLWRPLDENMDAILTQFEKWGIKGVKVDFIQRADQYVTNFYQRLAKKAADHHLMVDYHGGMKPSGMRRAYPNIINYEAVKGLENTKWDDRITAKHDVTIPFTRMTAGPMDFTPGAMDNVHKENFMARFDRPMSLGTRAHQMAMYVAYEAPLQMLSDSPSNYLREKECTSFIAKIPTTWDETRVLEAKVSEYLLIARRHGGDWYIGGMTDEDPRAFTIDFSFLPDGKDFIIEWIEDGPNSDKMAKDYKKVRKTITSESSLPIEMHKAGGWVARIHENS